MEKEQPFHSHRSTLAEIDRMLLRTRCEVREERDRGPALSAELTTQLQTAEIALAGVRKQVKSGKAHCKKRKREIDEWKQWYNGLPQTDKAAELARLDEEIAWRATDIAAKEAEIQQNYEKLLRAEGECEQLKVRLEALDQQDARQPVDSDPRIQHLLAARQAAAQQTTPTT